MKFIETAQEALKTGVLSIEKERQLLLVQLSTPLNAQERAIIAQLTEALHRGVVRRFPEPTYFHYC